MNKQKYFLISSIVLPILVLLLLVIYRIVQLHTYPSVIVPIVAYDPRAFLTGHYLVFNLTDDQKGQSLICKKSQLNLNTAFGCWKHGEHGWQVTIFGSAKDDLEQCQLVVKGSCANGYFIAKPMRFSIPEQYAEELTKAVLTNRASIEVIIKNNYQLQPTHLLIDNQPWEDVITKGKN